MRVDAKVEGPRQSMSWLHTWASLILGWLLYAIFLTGSLSFFQTEITTWMKPEFHQSVPSKSQLEQTQIALNFLQQNHPNAGSWSIQLPNSRQNTTTLNIRKEGEDPKARRGGERITIDSSTGQILEARDTRGGSFLYRFHFELYGLPRTWARWIVGIATMLMLVAIISGIITHKKIFKDFFTFRSGKGQRSWLDAHNATAVFALPFHIMITFSGLLLLLFTLMPWGINQIYENRGDFLQDQRKTLVSGRSENGEKSSNNQNRENSNRPSNVENREGGGRNQGDNTEMHGEGRPNRDAGENQQVHGEGQNRQPFNDENRQARAEAREDRSNGEMRERSSENSENRQGREHGEGGENQQMRADRSSNENSEPRQMRGENEHNAANAEGGQRRSGRGEGRRKKGQIRPAPLADLAPILAQAQKEWKDNPVASINIVAPNTNQAKIELRALNAESVAHRGVYATLEFDGVTGKNITDESAKLLNPSIPNGIYNVVTVLHEARGVDLALRWLLFLSGILGTIMVATGLILWCVKRAPQQQKQGFKSFGYRLVEVTNIAAIIGLPIACAAYFYANRFIPVALENRLNWEIRTFFIVWLLTLIYAIFRTNRQAWLELLSLATLAFALLPIINFTTGGQALWNTIAHGQWVIASFDLAMWVLALLFFFSWRKVKNHKGLAPKKSKSIGKEHTEQEDDA